MFHKTELEMLFLAFTGHMTWRRMGGWRRETVIFFFSMHYKRFNFLIPNSREMQLYIQTSQQTRGSKSYPQHNLNSQTENRNFCESGGGLMTARAV